jgi:hypothetical protein
VAPSGRRTQSEGETLQLLLTTHFLIQRSRERRQPLRLPYRLDALTAGWPRQCVEWATDSFAQYNSPGVDGIFPALLQKAREVVIPHLVKIFRACLETSYVPAIWKQVKVVFIPKHGRNSYSGPRDYRPISLKSFLLKTSERLVDRYLRDEALALVLQHSNQRAYQAGKSVQTALHQLVVRFEKALDQQETALGFFLDIEGVFNPLNAELNPIRCLLALLGAHHFLHVSRIRVNTCYDTMCKAIIKHGSKHIIVRWIRATLEGRVAVTTLGGSPVSRHYHGLPQGGVSSPLLWCLVVDDLLTRLSRSWIFIQGYADDMSSCCGKIPKHGVRTHVMGPFDRRDVVQRDRADG